MAANTGHLLVGKTIRLIRLAVEKASRAVRDKIPQAAPLESQAEPVYARITTRQPANRVAALRQSQNRGFSTQRRIDHTVRQYSSTSQNASKVSRASYPASRTGQRVSQLSSRTPFASTLRPNLTGGTLSRSAGGYSTGAGKINGVRYFSHTPTSPAEVVQNVSQAVRSFWLSGQKLHFNGYDPKTGEKRFRVVSTLQDKALNCISKSHVNAAGSFIDFKVSPTITAIGPLSTVPRCSTSDSSCDLGSNEDVMTITNSELLTTLEIDFARALKDLAAIMNDLKHLSSLGSLPLILINQTTLRVRFPGCDRDTVENLCSELNIRRGIVGQDADFEESCGAEMALMFPFAPSDTPSESFSFNVVFENENVRRTKRQKHSIQSRREYVDWENMMSPARPASLCSQEFDSSHDLLQCGDIEIVDNPWLSSTSGYSSLHASDDGHITDMFFQPTPHSKQYASVSAKDHNTGYEGLEGVYRFIEECDRAQLGR